MNEVFTVPEVARLLRVDVTTVHRWAKAGLLEVVVLPHAGKRHIYRIKSEVVQKILKDNSEAKAE